MTTYDVAEKFHSVQGEGMYAGTPMAFIRFVGCSVGKKICQYCDTDFDRPYEHLGGGDFTTEELLDFVGSYEHVCLTGGEPLDQPELHALIGALSAEGCTTHIETSGTIVPEWLADSGVFLTVCPKPGWKPEIIEMADEVKVIVPGLGNTLGWPTIRNAKLWAQGGKVVYLQPRNAKLDIDYNHLRVCEELCKQNPELRLSVQLHKILRVR
jgi:organic radical activating enzyme